MEEKVVVLYIRISKSDDDIHKKTESNSITSQRLLLNKFLDNHPDLAHFPRFEAVDDGYSGTNADRPMLREVLRMAESGKVQALCCEDTSRFFRNHIQAGRFIDKLFPLWNVRFIALTDGYDSEDYRGMTASMEQAVRNIVYAQYPKMLSRATLSGKMVLMKQGKFVGGFAPFGYAMHPTERHTLVIDEESAKTIRLIFENALEGKKVSEIVEELNLTKVETMSQYFRRKNPDTNKYNFTSENQQWKPSVVYQILKNLVYTGAMVGHKSRTPEIGSKKVVKNDPIIIEDTHEAIVTKEEFSLAQNVISKKPDTPPKVRVETTVALWGIIRCGYCGSTLKKVSPKTKAEYYRCQFDTRNYDTCHQDLRMSRVELEDIVYRAIGDYVKTLEMKPLKKVQKIPEATPQKNSEKEVKKLQKSKLENYEKYTQGQLSKEDFMERKKEIDRQVLEIENHVPEQVEVPSPAPQCEDVTALVNLFHQSERLTRPLAKKIISCVHVYTRERIEIDFKEL